MTKLADITFEAASQTGVTLTASGSGALSERVNSALAGLIGSWRHSYTVPTTSGATAWADLNLATISGSSVGLGRSVGGTFRLGSSGLHLERMGLFTLRGGASGAVLLAGVFTDLTTGNIVLRYNTNSGVQQVSVGNTLRDGSAHTFHLYYLCSPTLSTGQVTLLVDGVSVFSSTTISNSTISYGSGVTNVYLGQYFGAGASSQIQGSGTFDGLYIGDAATAEVSAELGSVLTGNTSPIAAASRTLTLTSTAGSPTWASSDTSVMTVSGGVVTLQQAAGGIATISDGFNSTTVEFLPRTLTYTVGTGSYAAPVLSHTVTLSAVSDGYTGYPDIYPSITPPAGVTLDSITGTSSPWTASYTVPSAGTYSISINGASFSVSTPAVLTAAVAATGSIAHTGTAAVVASIVSGSAVTAAVAATGTIIHAGTAAVAASLVDLAYVPLTAWEEFQPFVGLDLPGGVPPPVLEHHARQACIEFFQKSLVWQRTLSMTTSAGLAKYAIQAPTGAAVVKLLEQASIGGRPVGVAGMECARDGAQRGTLDGIWTDDLATLNVAPTPAESGVAILVAAALKPLQASTGIPSVLFEQYAEPISLGILARLLSMKGRAWSNPQKATDMKRDFEYAIADAAWAAASGFSRAPVRTKISLM